MTKFVVATGLTIVFAAVPELIAALISGGGSVPGPGEVGLVPSGPAVRRRPVHRRAGLLGDLQRGLRHGLPATTRAIAVGLLYVLVWEVLLSNFVSGVKLLSVSHYGLGIANGLASDPALEAGLGVLTSVVMGAIVTVVALALAMNLLSSFTLKGEPA
jgi:hypothetical protein